MSRVNIGGIVEFIRTFGLPLLVGLNIWAAMSGRSDPALCYAVAFTLIALIISTSGYFGDE